MEFKIYKSGPRWILSADNEFLAWWNLDTLSLYANTDGCNLLGVEIAGVVFMQENVSEGRALLTLQAYKLKLEAALC